MNHQTPSLRNFPVPAIIVNHHLTIDDLKGGFLISLRSKKMMSEFNAKPDASLNFSLEEKIETIFSEVFSRVSKREEKLNLKFYPFAGLSHTIRIRNQQVYVRISDLLTEAPDAVYFALAHILIRKLLRLRPNGEAEAIYRQFSQLPELREASDQARQARGRKILTGSSGKNYNLVPMFFRLNEEYFDLTLARPVLSWSTRRTKRILGHYDASHDCIVISRSLDSVNVPAYVVEFVLYHEMLHIKHQTRIVNGRRRIHTAAFRADEREFAFYTEAEKWIENFARRR